MRNLIVLVVICGLFLTGCTASTKQLKKVSLDMTKEEIIKKIGEPTVVRGAIKNKFGQNIEVWEYKLAKGKTGKQLGAELFCVVGTLGLASPLLMSEGEIQNYWLYFYDDKLVQWGQAGDWKKEADKIYDFNFNTTQQVTR